MKWQIRRVEVENGSWWEATRPDGKYLVRHRWADLVFLMSKLYNHLERRS